MNVKDFFTGVTHLFIIFFPGFVTVLAFIYVVDADLVQEIDFKNLNGFLFIAASYLVGHIISYLASYYEDSEQFAKDETSPLIRAMVRKIISSKVDVTIGHQENIRRWAASILREEDSKVYGEIVRMDADRRFFRNIRVVLFLIIVLLLVAIIFYIIESSNAFNFKNIINENDWLLWFLAISIIIIPFTNSRYKNQNKKYTQLVFESLVCRYPDMLPEELISTEIRWFLEEIPQEILDIFSDTLKISRKDHYWIKPINGKKLIDSNFKKELFTRTGIKHRESNLESKTKLKDVHSIDDFLNINGKIEVWEKKNWGIFPEFFDLKPKDWICVEKTMQTIKFKYENQNLTKVHENTFLTCSGCKFELAELKVKQAVYWTIGFEAFGEKEEQLPVLEMTVNETLSKLKGIHENVFPDESSKSYPAWISEIIRKKYPISK